MKDIIFDEFQNSVFELLVRHKSILDVITKLQESGARVNRAVVKAVTSCGCLKVNAEKQRIPENISLKELKDYLDSHVRGNLCENCREVIEKELGTNLFYIAALCNSLDINLYDVMLKEYKKVNTLGIYNLL